MSNNFKAVLWVLLILFVAWIGLSWMRGVAAEAAAEAAAQAEDEARYPLSVEYKVECIRCGLTYSNEDGGTEQMDVNGPWSKKFGAQRGQHLYISAQNAGYGNVDVSILIEGEKVKSSHSEGQHHIATASTRCP